MYKHILFHATLLFASILPVGSSFATLPLCILSPQEEVSRSKTIVEAVPVATETTWKVPTNAKPSPETWKQEKGRLIRYTKYVVTQSFKGEKPKIFWLQQQCRLGSPMAWMYHHPRVLGSYCQHSHWWREMKKTTPASVLLQGKTVTHKLQAKKRWVFLGAQQKTSPKGKVVFQRADLASHRCEPHQPRFWPTNEQKKLSLLKKLIKKENK
ncbi:MAG: hypothetical protein H6728_11785 [Myxococcales bacterium]|nr:hypothetical protein [Myxococcales bacterium]